MLQKSTIQVSYSSAVVLEASLAFFHLKKEKTRNSRETHPQTIHKNKYSVQKPPVTSNFMSKSWSQVMYQTNEWGGQGCKWRTWGRGKDGGGGRAHARSLSLQRDAIVYIDSVTVRELFVLTGEEASQWSITTDSVPRSLDSDEYAAWKEVGPSGAKQHWLQAIPLLSTPCSLCFWHAD